MIGGAPSQPEQTNADRIAQLVQSDPGFAAWKAQNAPHDSGMDYDLYGAYKAGLQPSENHHFPDTFKLPSHPRFSVESIYWQPGMPAGVWGPGQDNYIRMAGPAATGFVQQHGQNISPDVMQGLARSGTSIQDLLDLAKKGKK